MTVMVTRTRVELKEKIVKKLLKKPQTLAEISEKISGSTVKQLCVPMGEIVREGNAVKHKGTPPGYSKAAS